MAKTKLLLMPTELWTEAHYKVVKTFEQVMAEDEKILLIGVKGPYHLPENNLVERIEKGCGYCCSRDPCARVIIGVDGTLEDLYFSSLKSSKEYPKISDATKSLQDIKIMVNINVVPLREISLTKREESRLMEVRDALEYMFGPNPEDFTIVYSGRQGYHQP
jgi:hypothetical protein